MNNKDVGKYASKLTVHRKGVLATAIAACAAITVAGGLTIGHYAYKANHSIPNTHEIILDPTITEKVTITEVVTTREGDKQCEVRSYDKEITNIQVTIGGTLLTKDTDYTQETINEEKIISGYKVIIFKKTIDKYKGNINIVPKFYESKEELGREELIKQVAEFDEEIKKTEEEVIKIAEEVTKITSEVEDIQEDILNLEAANARCTDQIYQLQSQKAQLSQQCELDKQTAKANLEKERAYQQELYEVKIALAEAEEDPELAKQLTEELKKKLNDLNGAYKEKIKELEAALEKNLGYLDNSIAYFNDQIKANNAQLETAKTALEKSQKALSEAQAALEEASVDLTTKRNQIIVMFVYHDYTPGSESTFKSIKISKYTTFEEAKIAIPEPSAGYKWSNFTKESSSFNIHSIIQEEKIS